eukprot:jgi/Tetstr1/454171/TSEL_041090.t1
MNACKGIVIVDTSYVVFAKWYSALSWYKVSINRNPDVSTILESEVFRSKLASMFEQNIMRVVKQRGIPDADIVFARDCNRYAVWRRSHFDAYKDGRSHNGNFNSEVFNFVYTSVLPGMLERHGGCVIGTDGAEADDVIGVLTHFVRERRPDETIVILSNDNDCIQLVDDNTTVMNLFMQNVGVRRGDLSPSQYLTSRVLAGDRSDNIPSIVPRCGPRTAARLAQEHDEPTLRSIYEGSHYARNELLMNLRNTPVELKRNIIAQYEAHLEAARRGGAAEGGDE